MPRGSKSKPNSVSGKLRIWAAGRKQFTTSEALGAIGKYITASMAMRAYNRFHRYKDKTRTTRFTRPAEDPVRVGKRAVILDLCNHLYYRGVLERVKPGVYRVKKKAVDKTKKDL